MLNAANSLLQNPTQSENVKEYLKAFSPPLGPPPVSAIISFWPSGRTRVTVPLAISTKIIDPSGIAIGPSGKRRSSVIVVNADIILPFIDPIGGASFEIISGAQCVY